MSLAIISTLAVVALPYAEVAVVRSQELELRRALREMRGAIDRFHADVAAGRVSRLSDGVSDNGYPRSLEVLVEGVDSGDARGGRLRYLRRIPRDPFAPRGSAPAAHWELLGYNDRPDTIMWGGADVYDVRSRSARRALDGTVYREW